MTKRTPLLAAMLLTASAPCFAQTAILYVGQITTFATTFCPASTLPTDGRLLPINQNQALFALLGTTYGGDGATTFALPNYRAPLTLNRAPLITCIAIFGIFPSQN